MHDGYPCYDGKVCDECHGREVLPSRQELHWAHSMALQFRGAENNPGVTANVAGGHLSLGLGAGPPSGLIGITLGHKKLLLQRTRQPLTVEVHYCKWQPDLWIRLDGATLIDPPEHEKETPCPHCGRHKEEAHAALEAPCDAAYLIGLPQPRTWAGWATPLEDVD